MVLYQTNPETKVTTFTFKVTNFCNEPVLYVEFNLDSPIKQTTLSLNSPSSGSSVQMRNYMWNTEVGAPDGVTSVPLPRPTKYLRFRATDDAQTNMRPSTTRPDFEIFTFKVTGYTPSYSWVYRMHVGASYDAYGYIDLSQCICPNCDSSHSKRVIDNTCKLGYPDSSSSRASTNFNENEVLYAYAINPDNSLISLYMSDEWPMTVGIGNVVQNGVSKKFY